ncbi:MULTISPECIES: hypothetical protein [unclassified Arthrobacter]|uniref:hypothetical protein n=1 Tax=unclassified Arthrobacter TaxID=235627 RepID=UPI0033913781
MIIQAGFDLQILVRPLVVQEGRVLPKLVVIALDADMQLDGIKVASDEFAGSLEPHYDASLDWMDLDWTRYFAIAHAKSGLTTTTTPSLRSCERPKH